MMQNSRCVLAPFSGLPPRNRTRHDCSRSASSKTKSVEPQGRRRFPTRRPLSTRSAVCLSYLVVVLVVVLAGVVEVLSYPAYALSAGPTGGCDSECIHRRTQLLS